MHVCAQILGHDSSCVWQTRACLNFRHDTHACDDGQEFALKSLPAMCLATMAEGTRSSLWDRHTSAWGGMSSGHSISSCHWNFRQKVCKSVCKPHYAFHRSALDTLPCNCTTCHIKLHCVLISVTDKASSCTFAPALAHLASQASQHLLALARLENFAAILARCGVVSPASIRGMRFPPLQL